MQPPIKTAIWGTGYGMNVLLPVFAASPDFQVVALCGRNAGKLGEAAKRFAVPEVLSDGRQLLEAGHVEAVALALPPLIQGQVAPPLAAAGRHLLLEKPVAASLPDARALAEAAAGSGARIMVDFGFRFVSAFQQFQRLLEKQVVGRVKLVDVEWLLATRAKGDLSWNWKSDARQGGGTLNMMGSHVLDYLLWCFGELGLQHAQKTTIVANRPDADTGQPRPVRADDTCQLLLRLADGAPVTVNLSTAAATNGPHRIRAHCEDGVVELSNPAGNQYFVDFKVEVAEAADQGLVRKVIEEPSGDIPGMDGHTDARIPIVQRLVVQFARTVRGEIAPSPSLEDGLRVQRLLDEAHAG